MKRLMPASLITFLQSNPNCEKADLFAITLPTGNTFYATSGQWKITLSAYNPSTALGTPGWTGPTTTFESVLYGRWSRGAVTSEASFSCGANTMDLTCVPQPATVYPGTSIGILAAALVGLFDAAQVTVYTAYFSQGQYGNTSAGIEIKFQGTIKGLTDINRIKAEFSCSDAMYLLNQKVPARLFQSNCMWGFCDVNCTLNPATYTTNFTAKAGSTQITLTPAVAFTQPAGWATQGVVKCTSGANSGLSQTVSLHDGSGNLQMLSPWLLPVSAGDTFSVIAGCSKQLTSCKSRVTAAGGAVDNSINFGGFPFIPPPTSAF